MLFPSIQYQYLSSDNMNQIGKTQEICLQS